MLSSDGLNWKPDGNRELLQIAAVPERVGSLSVLSSSAELSVSFGNSAEPIFHHHESRRKAHVQTAFRG